MRISPQAILQFHQEVRRQLVSLDICPRRKVIGVFAHHGQKLGTCERNHTISTSASLKQSAQAGPVRPDETVSFEPSSQTTFSSWVPGHGSPKVEQRALQHLPLTCPGCGALTQDVNRDDAGFYTRSRRSAKEYIRRVVRAKASIGHGAHQASAERKGISTEDGSGQHDASPAKIVSDEDGSQLGRRGVVIDGVPFCDRCHNLLHQSKGVSIAHPTIDSIADTIAESPYRRNHVYHVLDAADFPLSLIPSIFNRLVLARPRSQNRRSQHDFSSRTTISFIITRSDLLAPQKELVDSLMPYFTSVLRQALGRKGQDMRLGNVHLVSAKRGWWTREIKEAIYKRGGGNWMVGKFNVGKSNLFEVLYPKGHDEQAPVYSRLRKEAEQDGLDLPLDQTIPYSTTDTFEEAPLPESSLLPPPQPLTPYPTLPLVSSLPGTTASPIRLPFGSRNHPRGELIDLPGLPRGNLSDHVSPEHQRTLLMEHRPTVTQQVLKPGQSLLLGGGLVRITPLGMATSNPNDEAVILAYPFVPLPAHVTSTEKAMATQLQDRESGVTTMLAAGAGESMRSAGIFSLETDVTKSRSGALLRAGVPMAKLPFRVKGTDILVEGVGWIELACQVRHRRRRRVGPHELEPGHRDALSFLDEPSSSSSAPSPSPSHSGRNHNRRHHPQTQTATETETEPEPDFPNPQVEIFTPNGTSVGQRPTMGAWMLIHGARKPGQRRSTKAIAQSRPRPRGSMKGAKKRDRARARLNKGTEAMG